MSIRNGRSSVQRLISRKIGDAPSYAYLLVGETSERHRYSKYSTVQYCKRTIVQNVHGIIQEFIPGKMTKEK